MEVGNTTSVTAFILMGLTNNPWLQLVLFVFFFSFYLIGIFGNLIIMILVIRYTALQSPMYFLLANLSFLDIVFASIILPKTLIGFFVENWISLNACIVQMHFFHFFGSMEATHLATMAYDRYAAICHPLRYNVIMNRKMCFQLVFCTWVTGFTYSLILSVMVSELPYCNNNKIRHFFCDVKPLIKLACTDTHVSEIILAIDDGVISVGAFFLTMFSYCYISIHLIKIKSANGRRKAFSTCSSHLIIVILYYGTAMCTYLGPVSEDSIERDKLAAIIFTVITPALNPIIYTLRNKEVKKFLRKLFTI
ncbi:olfactory receptor 12D1-like [Discoglossus pictus]